MGVWGLEPIVLGEGDCEQGGRCVCFNVGSKHSSGTLCVAKQARPKKEPKPPKVDNPDAVRRMAEVRRGPAVVQRPDFSKKRSPAVEEAFLDGLRACHSVSRSAWAAGIHESTAYNWRNDSLASRDEETGELKDDFAKRWDVAYEAGVDTLEQEAVRRARDGVEKPVYQGGIMVGTITEYSDTLMGLVLRGKRPGRYNTERHEHTGLDGGAIVHDHNIRVEFVDAEPEQPQPVKGKAK